MSASNEQKKLLKLQLQSKKIQILLSYAMNLLDFINVIVIQTITIESNSCCFVCFRFK